MIFIREEFLKPSHPEDPVITGFVSFFLGRDQEEQRKALSKFIFLKPDIEECEKRNTSVLKKSAESKTDSAVSGKMPSEKDDPENFIRSLQVSYVSDTEIKIKCGKQRSKTFNQTELGFKKANSEIWKEFIQILTRPDHNYHVGKAHVAKRVRKESYDVARKRLSEINKKLVSFFNKNYQAQLPNKFKVYALIPEKREAPGIYRFKFEIAGASQVAKANYENLSKEELIHEIEKLSAELDNLSNRGDEDSEEKINEIKDTLYPAMKIATNKGWLTKNRALGYLNPSKDYVSPPNQGHKRKKHPDLMDILSADENQED